MRKLIVIVSVVLLCFSSISYAEINEGMSELGLNISSQKLEQDNGGEYTLTIMNFFYGYFFSRNIQFAGNINIVTTDDGTTEDTNTALELQAKYHFVDIGPSLVPYVGGLLGTYAIDSGSATSDGLTVGFFGGLKYFVSETTSINAEYSYKEVTLEDNSGAETDAEITTMSIGYSIYF